MKIKAILDTNVFISGVFWKGPPFEILKAWQEQRFRLAISVPILEEYRRVLDQLTKERVVPVVLTSILKIVELHSEMVEPVAFAEPVCSDPDDDKFLEAAIAAGADYVVTALWSAADLCSLARTENENEADVLSDQFVVFGRFVPQGPERAAASHFVVLL